MKGGVTEIPDTSAEDDASHSGSEQQESDSDDIDEYLQDDNMEEITEEEDAAMEEDHEEGLEERSVSGDVEESDMTEPMKNGLSTDVRGRGRKFLINIQL